MIAVLLRVSTDSQELESQREEMVNFVSELGYGREDIIFVEKRGASAVKMDDDYMRLIDDLECLVVEHKVSAVAVWHLNRLGRNESMLMKIKELLIKNGVQLYIKNPEIRLLDDDGKENYGASLAFSLFAAMSVQEDIERKEKMRRGKYRNKKEGKTTGGPALYGYRFGKDGYAEVCDEEAEVVRKIFMLYVEGRSMKVVSDELNDRGYSIRGKRWYMLAVRRILQDRTYIGERKLYERIVSDDLFAAAESIRKSNSKELRNGNNEVLLTGKLVCPYCGRTMRGNGGIYKCGRIDGASRVKCDGRPQINKERIEAVVMSVVKPILLCDMAADRRGVISDVMSELNVIDQKMKKAEDDLIKIDQKMERVVMSFVDGLIDKKKRDEKIADVNDEKKKLLSVMSGYYERKIKLNEVLDEKNLLSEYELIDDMNFDEMKKAVGKYIDRVEYRRLKKGCFDVDVFDLMGYKHRFYLDCNNRAGRNYYIYDSNNCKLLIDL